MAARENILLIRLKSIGDILFTLPAVHAVRENFPGARLHFLVSKEFAPLLRGFAEVDEVIPFDRAAFHSKFFPAVGLSAFRLVRRLRRENFSLVIDLQGYGETAWLSWLSGAPERWASVYESARAWACTRGAWRDITLHPAEWNLSLLRQCGLRTGEVRNEYIVPEDALAEARKFFAANNLDPARPTLFLQPFTSTPFKDWPLENFLALARHWQARGWQVLFGGGPSDRAALEPARAAGFVVAAGAPLLVTAGLMKLSTFVAGADTGLLHLAVAAGKRVVMLMPSAAIVTRPFQHSDWALAPAHDQPISSLETKTVIEACTRALDEQRSLA